jgi:hypothetical protein
MAEFGLGAFVMRWQRSGAIMFRSRLDRRTYQIELTVCLPNNAWRIVRAGLVGAVRLSRMQPILPPGR